MKRKRGSRAAHGTEENAREGSNLHCEDSGCKGGERRNVPGQEKSVVHEAARLGVSIVGMQDTRRVGRTNFGAAASCCGSEEGGQQGVGLTVHVEDFERHGAEDSVVYVEERCTAMRIEMQCDQQQHTPRPRLLGRDRKAVLGWALLLCTANRD